MGNSNQKRTDPSFRQQESGELDRVLDAMLGKDTAAEPRLGLEQRILANLRSEQQKQSQSSWLRWTVAVVTAVLVATMLLAWRLGTAKHRTIAKHPSNTMPVGPPRQDPHAVANSSVIQPEPDRAKPITIAHDFTRSFRTPLATTSLPKLEQFPSPQPLSKQEQILANYIARYPEQAALIAEARMQALRHDAEERKTIDDGDRNSPE